MMDEMLFDFLAYEFFVDGLTEPTEIACPACGESLVYIVDREIYFSPGVQDGLYRRH